MGIGQIIFHTGNFPEGIYHSYEETKKALQNKDDFIRTTQMCFLSTKLLEQGYDIWIKEPNRKGYLIFLDEKGNVICNETKRKLSKKHNLFKLWKSGEFNSVRMAE